ncbi:MAG: hypothetical protein VYC39_06165 [Myxococcota bacterium]|nr:hypothetical protein [Myxococcota bacterium]
MSGFVFACASDPVRQTIPRQSIEADSRVETSVDSGVATSSDAATFSDAEEMELSDTGHSEEADAGAITYPDAEAPAMQFNPTACTTTNPQMGECECSTEPGFTTYAFNHAGQQRCLTVFVDPNNRQVPKPLVIQPNCYSANRLEPAGKANSARNFGFHTMFLTSADGNWEFPNDNRINQSNYQSQCDETASKDIGYLQGVFEVVDDLIANQVVDPQKVFISGFSQNSMFALFAATCFSDRIAGIWQGGSGLFSASDGSTPLPQCEGVCTRSDFLTYNRQCRQQAPCSDCEYFPVYPAQTSKPIKSCIFMYENDSAAATTAVPAYRALKNEGHDPTLLIFSADNSINLGGHRNPVNEWAWITSCLGFQDECSTDCSNAVVQCINRFRTNFRDRDGNSFDFGNPMHRNIASFEYSQCLVRMNNLCAKGCSATDAMLTLFETVGCKCTSSDSTCNCQVANVPENCR